MGVGVVVVVMMMMRCGLVVLVDGDCEALRIGGRRPVRGGGGRGAAWGGVGTDGLRHPRWRRTGSFLRRPMGLRLQRTVWKWGLGR